MKKPVTQTEEIHSIIKYRTLFTIKIKDSLSWK